MPYEASYVDDGKGVQKRGIAVVTGIEIYNGCMHDSLDRQKSSRLRYALIDFTETTEMRVTPGDIRRLVEMNRKLVAPSDQSWPMARLWHTLSDDLGWESNVFHYRPDAIAWLRKQFQHRARSSAILDEFPLLSEAT